MIEHEKEKYGWEFLFLGANIDAVETAAQFGIREDRAVNFHSDQEGNRPQLPGTGSGHLLRPAAAPPSRETGKETLTRITGNAGKKQKQS